MPGHRRCHLASLQWHRSKAALSPLLRSHPMARRLLLQRKTSPLSWSQSSVSQANKSSQICREQKANAPIDRSSAFLKSRAGEKRKQPHRPRKSPRDLRFRYHLYRLWWMMSFGARVVILRRRRDLRWRMCRFEGRFTCLLSSTYPVAIWSSL